MFIYNRTRVIAQSILPSSRQVHAHEVDELTAAVQKARERAPASAVLEIEHDLAHTSTRARGVDGHGHLHAEALGEGQHRGERPDAQSALPGNGRLQLQAAAAADGP